MIINDAGTYTLKYTATDDCGKTSTVDRELVVIEPVRIYGVKWNSDHSQFERTDSAEDFADPQPAVNNGTGSSPFDNIMPWSGMQVVEDAEAGTVVSIPKFWFKCGVDNNMQTLQISPTQQEGFFVSPAHADRGDGQGERDIVYVGRYHCSDNYKSVTGATPKGNATIGTFRTGIHALGDTVWQNDIAMFWTIRMLYLVEFGSWDSQSCIGYGCSPGSAKFSVGLTDNMGYHTGTSAIDRTTYGSTQYRNIEGLWDNCEDFLDGIYKQSTTVYLIKNPNDFNNSTGGEQLGTLVNMNGGRIYEFEFDESHVGFEYFGLPHVASSQDYSLPLYDEYYSAANAPVFTYGARSMNSLSYGLFRMAAYFSESSTNVNVGSRLMKLPSA